MSTMPTTTDTPTLDCDGYRKLLAAVQKDLDRGDKWHNYRAKLAWAVSRASHYAEKTGLTPEAILDAWEAKRDYWYMNFYQECNQPEIKADKVRVFATTEELMTSIGNAGFRCPYCAGVSKSPYTCNTGLMVAGKPCDWKVYGLFGHLGKGIYVFVTEQINGGNIFMPVAWEDANPQDNG
jgi:hypothetical protein